MNWPATVLAPEAWPTSSAPRLKQAFGLGRAWWPWVRLAGGAAILAVIIVRLGATPFLDALRLTRAWALAAAAAITALTTVCCAWRWSLVAHALEVDVPLRPAVSAYYQSQFLNVTLPSGVLGDVHRAMSHGRDVGAMSRSVRSVVWERTLGQAVQIGLTVVLLGLLASPVRSAVPQLAAVGAVTVLGLALVTAAVARRGSGLTARIAGGLVDDVRSISRAREAWPGVVLASVVAVVGHTVIFLIALRATGATVSAGQGVALALVVLLASAVPTNIAGWGPREGAAAWAFSSVGLSAAQGVTASVVYGVMVLVATLPGAVMLGVAAGTARRRQRGLQSISDRWQGVTMADRPYTLLSCGISIDGYLDDASDQRLMLSNDADLDRVDGLRAGCDAILVGAATVRNDNPRLLVRSQARMNDRKARGLSPTPIKVTVTARADLNPDADFFTVGDTEKLVYCGSAAARAAAERLGSVATVVDAGDPAEMRLVSEDLYARGVRRLLVEGGATVHTQFLTAGLADELHLVVAPFFVGDSRARRFVDDGRFPWTPEQSARLVDVGQIDDVAVLRYALSTRFGSD
jgi:riboflavin-specific deaminase-like protein